MLTGPELIRTRAGKFFSEDVLQIVRNRLRFAVIFSAISSGRKKISWLRHWG